MSLPKQQIDKRFFVFEAQRDPNSDGESHPLLLRNNNYRIWSDRLVLIEEQHKMNDEFYYFKALDLLMDESQPIRFRKTIKSYHSNVYPLNDEFGFITEGIFNYWHINFVKFDWDSNKFQLIEKFEKECINCWILVDKTEPSKFVLRYYKYDDTETYQLGKLIKEKIEIGEIHQNYRRFDVYSKDRLIYVDINGQNNVSVDVYDLMSKKEQAFEIDSSLLPENAGLYCNFEWVNERLYTVIKFKNTQKYGIVWTDLIDKRWNYFVGFETSLFVKELEFFNDKLSVNLKSGSNNGIRYLNKVEFHSISIRRPNPLRQSAWLLVVQVMKNRGGEDPYKAAKEFLPLNSDLRSPWFKDVERKTNEQKAKKRKLGINKN